MIVSEKNDSTSASQTASAFGPLIGMALAFAPATAYSVNGLLAFKMRPLHFTVQLFAVALCLTIFPCIIAAFELLAQGSTEFLQFDHSQLGFLVIIGIGMCFENLFQTLAFTYGGPQVTLFGFSAIVWSFLIDIFVFKRPISTQELVPITCIACIGITIGYLKSINKI